MTRSLRVLAFSAAATLALAGCPQEEPAPECSVPADCTATTVTECQVKTCTAGKCGIVNKAKGTPLTVQTPGDCKEAVCDGAGNASSRDDSADVFDDDNPCTEDVCTDGVPGHNPLAAGSDCGDGKTCDGAGNCVPPSACGNGQRDAGEQCDGDDLGGQDCASQGWASGTLVCSAGCTFDTTGCVPHEDCGNGTLEAGEDCDGAELNGQTCLTVPGNFSGGTLGCAGNCTFDTSGCTSGPVCGDGVAEGTEACDGSDLAGKDCASEGYASGDLACTPGCTLDTSNCVPPADCGNDVVDEGEQCDGADLDGQSCESQGFDRGDLACLGNCRLDTSGCVRDPVCGNDVAEAGEACDGPDLAGKTCVTEGFASGNLACSASCALDTSGCVPAEGCGNGTIDAGEVCDGAELGGETCLSQGFSGGGTLACADSCAAFDTSACVGGEVCGNGVAEGAEACDGSDLKGETCRTQGFLGGTLACTAGCDLDLAGCTDIPGCGNGTIDPGELCDGGDLGSQTCLTVPGGFAGGTLACATDCLSFDISECTYLACAAGETPYVFRAAGLPIAIPDGTAAALEVPFTIGEPGVVTSMAVVFSAVHPNVGDLDISLRSPRSTVVDLSSDNGGTGDNYALTVFTDAAATDIAAGIAPFTGSFQPEQPLSNFANIPLAGTWTLVVDDDTGGNVGELTQADLYFCTIAADTCGNGTVGAGEVCDGPDLAGNTCEALGYFGGTLRCADDCRSFDGSSCSMCAFGETQVALSAPGLPVTIPDGSNPPLEVPFVVTDPGIVSSIAVVFSVTHAYNSDLDISLRSPAGRTIDLSSDNSGSNYLDTVLADAATTPITSGTAPYSGQYKPEEPFSTFANSPAAGTWTLVFDDDFDSDVGTLTRAEFFFCTVPADDCGNGTIGTGEVCDGADLGGATCQSLGFASGTLACSADCRQLDLSGCTMCGPGETMYAYSASGLPQAIPGVALLVLPFAVSDVAVVRSVVVAFSAVHPYVGDLAIGLTAQDGRTVDLSSGNGSSGDDYLDTIFTDSAASPITSGSPPFTGQYRPEQPLSTFHNYPLAGTWTVTVDDTYPSADFGSVTRADLFFCTVPEDVCGNGTVGGREVCDGADLGGQTCSSFGYVTGTLACGADCLSFDLSGCSICQAGELERSYVASGLPLTIPDATIPGLVLPFDIVDSEVVSAAAVVFSAVHPYTADLDISLRSPRGDVVDLSSDNGGSGDNYTDTVFADLAANPITSGTPPFTGLFRPEVALSAVSNTPLAGTWTLTVSDDLAPNVGELTRAELRFCTVPADVCGNGAIGAGEVCDGDDLGGLTCSSFGYVSGTLACGADCRSFDFSGCSICQAGELERSYVASGLPLAIPDATIPGVAVPFDIVESEVVSSAAVIFSAVHPYAADLDISLRSPRGAVVDLSSDNGGSGDNYTDTVFIDLAASPITSGTPPFTGWFRPEMALSRFSNTPLAGTWTLTVSDDLAPNVGELTRAELFFCTVPADVCGNGAIGAGEVCDGADLGGATCESLGFTGGTLACSADCRQLDLSGCEMCGPGETMYAYSASGLPQAIPGDDLLVLPFAVSDVAVVRSVVVAFSAVHPYVGDLAIGLTAQDGRTVDLSSGNGSSGDDYLDTVFTDSAARSITSGSPPFTGQYRPEQPLSVFLDYPLAGTWTVTVDDTFPSADFGSVTRADLYFCTVPADVCGNGAIGAGEICDGADLGGQTCSSFGYVTGTLGCSADCRSFDLSGCSVCQPGELERGYTASGLPLAIPDATIPGLVVPFDIVDSEVVSSAAVVFSAVHPYAADLDISLRSPRGDVVDLSSDNGGSGDNYTDTVFIDLAANPITSGSPPFTGWFRPEVALSRFSNTPLAGTWALTVSDDLAPNVGALTRAELLFCTIPADVCGNGAIGAGEVCDGADLGGATCESLGFASGTLACSADCRQLDLSGCEMCGPGETLYAYSAPGLPQDIPGVDLLVLPFTVSDVAVVESVVVAFSAVHPYVGDLAIGLTAQDGRAVDLSSGNGSSGDDYLDTIFTDSAASPITSGSPPFTGQYRPEQPLSAFHNYPLAGTWTVTVDDTYPSADFGSVTRADLYFCTVPEDVCGNGAIGAGEVCDGADLGGQTCETLGFLAGTLSCAADCHSLDTSGCSRCPAGLVELFFSAAADLPVPIPDNADGPGVEVPIVINDSRTVGTVEVTFSATHGYDEDLDISLRSPLGTVVDLSSDNGGSSDNYTDTVFSDAATLPITSGTAPFTGPHQPEEPLSTFAGEPLTGSWTLIVDDDEDWLDGELTRYELRFCAVP